MLGESRLIETKTFGGRRSRHGSKKSFARPLGCKTFDDRSDCVVLIYSQTKRTHHQRNTKCFFDFRVQLFVLTTKNHVWNHRGTFDRMLWADGPQARFTPYHSKTAAVQRSTVFPGGWAAMLDGRHNARRYGVHDVLVPHVHGSWRPNRRPTSTGGQVRK